MSKYRPLSERLSQESADEWRPTFAEIEEVLGFPLPKAAQQTAWWAGGGKPHHRAWLDEGWEVGGLDKAAGGVHFRRAPVGLGAGSMEPTVPDPATGSTNEPSDTAARRAKVQRVAGGAAIVGGAVAILAGIGVIEARLFGRRRA